MKKTLKIGINYLCSVMAALFFVACDDTTDFLGSSVVTGPDYIKSSVSTFYPLSSTVKADTIYTRSSTAYLGKYTHPKFGSFESGFMAQFNVTEDYQIPGFSAFVPDNGIAGLYEDVYDRSITPVRFYMAGLYTGYFGDSTAVGSVNVYQLNEDLYNSDDIYYSNVNPENFYDDSDLLGSASFAPVDLSVSEEDREDNYQYVIVPLPVSKGAEIIRLYQYCRKNGLNFRNEFLKEFKGIYAKQVQGDGALMYLDQVRLSFHMDEYVLNEEGMPYQTIDRKDSVVTTVFSFSTTKEIVQVNKFRDNTPEALLEEDTCSHLKSPAGLFTRVRIPLKAINDSIIARGDTLSGVSVSFTIDSLKNDISGINPPDYLMMIRDTATVQGVFHNYQKEFFANNQLPDNVNAFASSLSSGTYDFSDIRRLLTATIQEYGTVENIPEYLDVLLIPINITFDGSTPISVNNLFKPSYAKLLGGMKDPERQVLKMKVYYSTFQ